jgi:hypothetical protein
MKNLVRLALLVAAGCTKIGIYEQPPDATTARGSDSGHGSDSTSGSDSGGGTTVSGDKIMFVTPSVYEGGKLGGLSGADTICEMVATAGGLTGTFSAWLATDTETPATRLTHSTGNYKLVDGSLIAAGWSDLVDGQIAHAIDLAPDGSTPTASGACMGGDTPTQTWTNVAFDGTEAVADFNGVQHQSCAGWTDLSADGSLGLITGTDPSWTDEGCSVQCTGLAALYCVQQ